MEIHIPDAINASPFSFLVPMNVELNQPDDHSIRITWDPPAESEMEIVGYNIEWSKGEEAQDTIAVGVTNEYTLTGLTSGQLITVYVCTNSGEEVFLGKHVPGSCSEPKQANQPREKGGWFF